MKYYDDMYGAGEACKYRTEDVLTLIADRYMANNPAQSFVFHSYRKDGFICGKDGRFILDLDQKFPDAANGAKAVVEAKFWQENDRTEYFAINCFGPAVVKLQGEICFKSGVEEEVNSGIRRRFVVNCKRGWNVISLYCEKTTSGFGAIFGVNEPKWRWKPFYSNVEKEEGKLGFRYRMKDSTSWLPGGESEPAKYPCGKIFGLCKGKYIYAGTRLQITDREQEASVKIHCAENTEALIYVNGRLTESIQKKEEEAEKSIRLPLGQAQVFLAVAMRHDGENKDWGVRLEMQEGCRAMQPFAVQGTEECVFYAGPFAESEKDLTASFDSSRLYKDRGEGRYFVLEEKQTVIRPVLENLLFARWNYPLGVTLYGLMSTARYLKDRHILSYVEKHIKECVKFYEYGKWDAQQYGYPEIDTQLLNISMLDDCGSFGSCMLEYYLGAEENGSGIETREKDDRFISQARQIADRIGGYMEKEQERQPDGAFYRICKDHFMENTLWADDLYMSIPFLCRYYRLTKDDRYVKDAVNQIRQFKKYLYMPEENYMSHVYAFRYHTATKMPWGRGNGWVFFSLSELLAVMEPATEGYEEMKTFFRTLADGYLARQRKDGMWPQLLSDPGSYPEASCTAMFVYGFSRGVRFGWLEKRQEEKAAEAARRGWRALVDMAIDRKGNVYGVCEGSAYSFKAEYYTKELGWVLNDPHGTGIVMLAGMELQKMEDREAKLS